MSITASTPPPAGVPATAGAQTKPAGSTRRFDLRRDVGLLVTPVVLGLVFLAYWTWLGTQELSSQAASALRSENLIRQTREQITITALSTIGVLLIAIPLGIGLTRPRGRRFAGPTLTVANAGQAIPAYGLLVLALAMLGGVFGRANDNFLQNTIGTWLGPGLVITVIALILFAILPVLRNTMVGLQQVDHDVIEAGLGMGMTRREVLWRIELPLAVPVMLAGVRTALVINVGMATLAFLIGGGGLGVAIRTGIQLSQNLVVLTGGVLTALLALSVDWLGSVVERLLRPKGI
jgi:osmoprotectant transport system permease protein